MQESDNRTSWAERRLVDSMTLQGIKTSMVGVVEPGETSSSVIGFDKFRFTTTLRYRRVRNHENLPTRTRAHKPNLSVDSMSYKLSGG